MAQQIKELAAKWDNLSLSLGTHVAEKKTNPCKLSFNRERERERDAFAHIHAKKNELINFLKIKEDAERGAKRVAQLQSTFLASVRLWV